MASENAIVSAKTGKHLAWKEAPICQYGVERQTTVSFAENAAVALWPARFLRTNAQDIFVQNPQNLDQRHRWAEMAASGRHDCFDDRTPQRLRMRIKRRRNRLELEYG